MSSISFGNVYFLFLAIPLLIVLAVPFAVAIRKDNRNGHNIASMVLHVLMAVLIAFAAAGTQIVTVMTETDVYVLADVSYSANRNLDTVDGYISELRKNLPRNSKLGVVSFGKDYKVTTELGEKFETVKDTDVNDTETNIVNALEYAGTLFKDGVIKRIVLITDGRQTYSGDANELSRAVANLQAQDVKVDAIYLNDNWDETVKEVQISSAEYTQKAYLNRAETVKLTVQSSGNMNAIVTLYKDGEPYKNTAVTLSLDINTITFDLDTSIEGKHLYRAEIKADGDTCDYNNVYSFSQTVTTSVNVLLLTSDNEDFEKISELYGAVNGQTGPKITHYNISVNGEVPVSVEDLCKYDEIVLSNVDMTQVNNYGMFVSSLNTVISSFGKSLVTFGNTGIQSADGSLNELDDMLPVRYGDVNGNPKLYTIVLDVSDSMQIWSRLILAKQAAAQLINFLSDDDYVCLIAFGEEVSVLQTPTDLSGNNREKVLDYIGMADRLVSGYGTYTSLGLKKALDTIKNLDFSEKQVMLVTDGLPYEGDLSYEDIEIEGSNVDRTYSAAFVEQMKSYGIQTSVLQVGGGNDGEKGWLRSLAEFKGGGEYYYADTEEKLGDVLFGDIQKDTEDAEITDTPSNVVKTKPRDEVLSYTDENGANRFIDLEKTHITDYILSSSKSSATTVLSVEYKVKSVKINVPLFAYWNYGNGKVQSYTGKISEIKVYGGAISQSNKQFFGNIISNALPAEKSDVPFTVSSGVDGKKARVELINLTYDQLQAAVSGTSSALINIKTPSGEELTDKFIFDSSIFYYEFITPEIGSYEVSVSYKYGIYDYSEEGGYVSPDASFIISYEPEYNSFTVFEASALYKMLNGNGTVIEQNSERQLTLESFTPSNDGLTIEKGKLAIKNDDSQIATYIVSLTVPFLIIAVVLFIVDIVIRKLKWKDIVSLFGGAKNKKGGVK